jgi:hypothetical protein
MSYRVVGVWGVMLSLAGCGGKDDAVAPATAGTSNRAGASSGGAGSASGGSTGSGGSSAGSGGSATSPGDTPQEICAASCATQAACLGVAESTCVTNCLATPQVFQGECETLQFAEFDCISGLSCDELGAYVDDKLAHATCGANYAEFATKCLRSGTMPPQACVTFCTKTADCDADARGVNGCAQTCNEVLTGYEVVGGDACARAFENAYACFGGLECSDIDLILDQGVTPAACAQHDQLVTNACL